MPTPILPEAAAVGKLVQELRAVRQSPMQRMYGFPLHSPQALVAALLGAADYLAHQSQCQAAALAVQDQRIEQMERSIALLTRRA